MNNVKSSGIIYTVVTLLFLLVLAIGYKVFTQPKIGSVSIEKVYENFEGSKLAMDKLEASKQQVQFSLDSLNSLHTIEMSDTITPDMTRIQRLRNEIRHVREMSEKKYWNLDEQLSNGILNQINECLVVYAEENSYDLIVSYFQGQGAIYFTDKVDVTDDFILRLNETY